MSKKVIGAYFPVYYWYEMPDVRRANEAFALVQEKYINSILPGFRNHWSQVIEERLPFLDIARFHADPAYNQEALLFDSGRNRLVLNTALFDNYTVEARHLYESVKEINRSFGSVIAVYPPELFDSNYAQAITDGTAYGLTITRAGLVGRAAFSRTLCYLEHGKGDTTPVYLSASATLLEIQLQAYLTYINQKFEASLAAYLLNYFPIHTWQQTELFSKHPEVHHTIVFSTDGEAWNPKEVIDKEENQ